MPKISTTKQDSASISPSGPKTSGTHPNVLKRNQVCAQSISGGGFVSPLPNAAPHFRSHSVVVCPYPYRPATNVADANWYVHPLTHARCVHQRLCRNGTSDHIIVPRRDALFTSLSAPNSSSDAQRPCSTCVRSHAHALTHAPRGAALPEHPECTFDEGTSRIFDRPLAVQRLKPLMK